MPTILGVALVLCFFSLAQANTNPPSSNTPAVKTSPSLGSLSDLNRSLESIAKKVNPAVVQIFASGYQPVASPTELESGMITRHDSSGSGVILTSTGYIITNSHVVRGAQKLKVLLNTSAPPGERKSILKNRAALLDATLIGIDFETDLAVLKIERNHLPFLELADSEEVRVGHMAWVFGSPRGLDGSVSMGIVSSVARQMKPENPMVYIQTDAPINPGNSGGPLVNSEGKVIGINTFIISRSGGNEGLGFAIPSNIVSHVFYQIREYGHVRRGAIGVKTQTIHHALAIGLGLEQQEGVILADVYPRTPAERAGLQVGDVVLSLNEKPMENARQFDVNLYRAKIGDIVQLKVLRKKQELNIRVTVAEKAFDPNRFTQMVKPETNLVAPLGILGLDIDKKVLEMLPPLRISSGIVIAASTSYAPYWAERLKNGDIIHAINNIPLHSLSELRKTLEKIKTERDVYVLQVEREGQLLFVPLEIED